MSAIKEDLHIHTNFSPCGHQSNSLENIISESIKKDMEKIAITEHYYSLKSKEGKGWVYIPEEKFLTHLRELKQKRERQASPLAILIGVEIDVRENGIDYVPKKILDSCEVVMACLHHIPGTRIRWNHFYREKDYRIVKEAIQKEGRAKLIERTMKLYLKISQDRTIHQIGHPFKELAMSTLVDEKNLLSQDLLISFYDNLRENGILLELSPSIWEIRTPESQLFISRYPDYLKLAKERGVNFYFGSDSHHPEGIGVNSKKEIEQFLSC